MEIGKISEKQVLNLAKKTYEFGSAIFDVIVEKCALLVIDMQDEFVKPHWTPYWVPEATRQVKRINNLIDHCRKKFIPIIFTVYSKTHNFLDRPKTLPLMPSRLPNLDIDQSSFFIKGKIFNELNTKEDDIIIHKPSYGAFYDTPLESILKNLEKDTVIICGTLTNYCCSTTARQAYERGFKVVFGSDVNSAHFLDLHEAELRILRRGFAKILSLDELIGIL
jgi:nicotinamidase-related amidase